MKEKCKNCGMTCENGWWCENPTKDYSCDYKNIPHIWEDVKMTKNREDRQYTQRDIDHMFDYEIRDCQMKFPEDCIRIQKIIQNYRGVLLSIPTVAVFWDDISDEWDAVWLTLPVIDSDILAYWDQYVDEWHEDKDAE